MSSRNTKGRHDALMGVLAAPQTQASTAVKTASEAKATPDSSVPALAKTGDLMRTELLAARARAETLQVEVDALRAAPAERKIPAHLITHGRFRDRHELGFHDAKFAELKASIQAQHGNKQPVLVRPLTGPDAHGHEYEVVWGHRRHRACLDLGLDVNAIVRTLTDREAVDLMTIENKHREDLSQFELARKYRVWLEEGLFENQQGIASKEGLNQATISRIMAINDLPDAFVARIADPRRISGNWAATVMAAIKRDPEDAARRLDALSGQVSPKDLLKALEAPDALPPPREVRVGERPVLQAIAIRGAGGDAMWSTLKLSTALSDEKLEKLAAFIAEL